MIGDEIPESAKAIQESAKAVQAVAKTTEAGLEATRELGGWVATIINEPMESVVGILSDKLRYMRWERQQRLTRRAQEFIAAKKLTATELVSPKLALPIIEHASLEENDTLQDMWARLISSAVDPAFKGKIRSAYIELISQIEVVDAQILKTAYDVFLAESKRKNTEANEKYTGIVIERYPLTDEIAIEQSHIQEVNSLDDFISWESIDNLMRLNCVAFYESHTTVAVPILTTEFGQELGSISLRDAHHLRVPDQPSYERISLTLLGVGFVAACMAD